jgi:hypothetical protein
LGSSKKKRELKIGGGESKYREFKRDEVPLQKILPPLL